MNSELSSILQGSTPPIAEAVRISQEHNEQGSSDTRLPPGPLPHGELQPSNMSTNVPSPFPLPSPTAASLPLPPLSPPAQFESSRDQSIHTHPVMYTSTPATSSLHPTGMPSLGYPLPSTGLPHSSEADDDLVRELQRLQSEHQRLATSVQLSVRDHALHRQSWMLDVERLQRELVALLAAKKEAETGMRDAEARAAREREQFAEREALWSQDRQALEERAAALNQLVAQAELDQGTISTRLQASMRQLETMLSRERVARETVEEAETVQRRLEEALESANSSLRLTEQERDEFKLKNEDLTRQLSEQTVQAQSLNAEVEDLGFQVTNLTTQALVLRKELADTVSARDILVQQTKELQEHLNLAQSDAEQRLQGLAEQLASTIAVHEVRVTELEQYAEAQRLLGESEAAAARAAVETISAAQEQRVVELQQGFEEEQTRARAQLESLQLQLSDEINELRAQLLSTSNALETATGQLAAMEESLDHARAQTRGLESVLQSAHAETAKVSEALTVEQEQSQALQQQVKDAQVQDRLLREQLAALQLEMAQERSAHQLKVKEIELERHKLKQDLDSASTQLAGLMAVNKQLHTSTSDAAKAEAELRETWEQERSSFTASLKETREHMRQLIEERDTIQQELTKQQAKASASEQALYLQLNEARIALATAERNSAQARQEWIEERSRLVKSYDTLLAGKAETIQQLHARMIQERDGTLKQMEDSHRQDLARLRSQLEEEDRARIAASEAKLRHARDQWQQEKNSLELAHSQAVAQQQLAEDSMAQLRVRVLELENKMHVDTVHHQKEREEQAAEVSALTVKLQEARSLADTEADRSTRQHALAIKEKEMRISQLEEELRNCQKQIEINESKQLIEYHQRVGQLEAQLLAAQTRVADTDSLNSDLQKLLKEVRENAQLATANAVATERAAIQSEYERQLADLGKDTEKRLWEVQQRLEGELVVARTALAAEMAGARALKQRAFEAETRGNALHGDVARLRAEIRESVEMTRRESQQRSKETTEHRETIEMLQTKIAELQQKHSIEITRLASASTPVTLNTAEKDRIEALNRQVEMLEARLADSDALRLHDLQAHGARVSGLSKELDGYRERMDAAIQKAVSSLKTSGGRSQRCTGERGMS